MRYSVSLLFLFIINAIAPSALAKDAVEESTPAQFLELIEQSEGAILLDVRTPEEVSTGVIPGAIAIDFYGPDFLEKLAELDVSKPILVYCRSGNRSGKAATLLDELGAKRIVNLKGGVKAWTAAGYALEPPTPDFPDDSSKPQ